MFKVINRKRYDTETAFNRAFYTNGGTWRDHNHVEETLYQKRTGEFFLHGKGGPATRYAVSVSGNTWDAGEKIIPLTYTEAQEWAEKHLDVEEYEALFGAIQEAKGAGGSVQINFRVSATCAATIRRRAAEAGLQIGDWLEQEVMK